MTYKLKIKVTKEILERSKNCIGGVNSTTECAVALAVRDIWPGAGVSGRYMRASYKPGIDEEITLPERVSEWIQRFDKTLPRDRPNLPEIEFEVEVPDSVIQTINIQEITELLKELTGK